MMYTDAYLVYLNMHPYSFIHIRHTSECTGMLPYAPFMHPITNLQHVSLNSQTVQQQQRTPKKKLYIHIYIYIYIEFRIIKTVRTQHKQFKLVNIGEKQIRCSFEIFPKLALANRILTALYKGPCWHCGNVRRAGRNSCL